MPKAMGVNGRWPNNRCKRGVFPRICVDTNAPLEGLFNSQTETMG